MNVDRFVGVALFTFTLLCPALCQQGVHSSTAQEFSRIDLGEMGIVLKIGEVHKPKTPSTTPQPVSTVSEFSMRGKPIDLRSNAVVKRASYLTITTKEFGTFRVVPTATGDTELWGSLQQKQKLAELAKSFDLPLSGQTSGSVQVCRSILGGRVSTDAEGASQVENCAWATLSHHDRLSGDFLGLVLRIPAGAASFDLTPDNTFLENGTGEKKNGWIAWFPDRTQNEIVNVRNGTSIGVKIDMPGIGSGEAVGVSQGSLINIGMGYGTMLFHSGSGDVTWNLAYADAGVGGPGTLTVDVSKSPGTSRILLLFRKTDFSVARLHFAGVTYMIQP